MNAEESRSSTQPPRLPFPRTDRLEGLAYLALALAAIVAVCQFETGIARFVPHAPDFAAQLKSSGTARASGAYAVDRITTIRSVQAAAVPRSATNGTQATPANGRRTS